MRKNWGWVLVALVALLGVVVAATTPAAAGGTTIPVDPTGKFSLPLEAGFFVIDAPAGISVVGQLRATTIGVVGTMPQGTTARWFAGVVLPSAVGPGGIFPDFAACRAAKWAGFDEALYGISLAASRLRDFWPVYRAPSICGADPSAPTDTPLVVPTAVVPTATGTATPTATVATGTAVPTATATGTAMGTATPTATATVATGTAMPGTPTATAIPATQIPTPTAAGGSVVTPTLYLNYLLGAPGSIFVVIGYNYPPGSSVDLLVNGLVAANVTADGSGGFSLLLQTPSGALPGFYVVTAVVHPISVAALSQASTTAPQFGVFHLVTSGEGAVVRVAPPGAPTTKVGVPAAAAANPLTSPPYTYLPLIRR